MSKIRGYTTGVFDLFHVGHLNILKKAKSKCDHLIVGVTTDKLARELKNRPPVVPYQERVQLVEAIRYVDKVVPQEEVDELADWDRFKFDRIFKGSDWEGKPKWVELEKKFQKKGVEVIFFPYTNTTSTTVIRGELTDLLSDE